MRSRKYSVERVLAPVLVGAVTMLVGASLLNLLLSVEAHSEPQVGDLFTFDPAPSAPLKGAPRLLVQRGDEYACILDLNTVRKNGGSLIVEAHTPGEAGAFHLHWAGDRTSPDNGDCGRTANLILDRREVDLLAVAAADYEPEPEPSSFAAGPRPKSTHVDP